MNFTARNRRARPAPRGPGPSGRSRLSFCRGVPSRPSGPAPNCSPRANRRRRFSSACGEARARTADPVGAVELYDRAASAAPNRPGLAARAEELRKAAADALLDEAARERRGRTPGRGASPGRARSRMELALRRDPPARGGRGMRVGRPRAGARVLPGGDRPRRGRHRRRSRRPGTSRSSSGDYAAAVEHLRRTRGSRSRISRPGPPRRASRSGSPTGPMPSARPPASRRLTRSGAALLVWWVFPEVREARVESAGIVATDVLERRDSRVMMRAVSLGLLEVDPNTHRARPDAPLTRVGGRPDDGSARVPAGALRAGARMLPGGAGSGKGRPGGDSRGGTVRTRCQNRGARPSAARSSPGDWIGSARSSRPGRP